MEALESDVFMDGVCSDIEGDEFNSEGCQWEAEVEEEEEEDERQAAAAKPPPAAVAIPEKVFSPKCICIITNFLLKRSSK